MTPEIVWHSKEPVFSADFHRRGPSWRLATGGADNDIKVTRNMRNLLEFIPPRENMWIAERNLIFFFS